MPGLTAKMQPVPDHGEDSYKGSGRLEDMRWQAKDEHEKTTRNGKMII
jgi:hypothetical protein